MRDRPLAPRDGMNPDREARRDAAQALRRILDAVEAGELEADSPQAKALLRRLQGAVVGLEAEEE